MSAIVRVKVPSRPGRYEVHVGRGLLASLGGLLRGLGLKRVVLLADPRAGRRHGEGAGRAIRRGGLGLELITLPAGERAKTWKAVASVQRRMAELGLDRGAGVVSLGGGAATDAGGFIAATWLRGVPHVALPTTLVGMVDAAVGGKTGINLPEGKNLVGAFHHPAAVLCDPDLLAGLPARELRAGKAEVVKTAWLAGASAWRRAESADLESLVAGCVRYKAGVVGRDPLERGERRVLNLGHTIGHGIEAAAGFLGMRHGEAVAVGLVGAARVARRLGRAGSEVEEALAERLAGCGLPLRAPRLDPEAVMGFIRRDKKRKDGRLAMVLPLAPGRVEIVEDVPWPIVRSVVRGLLAE